MESTGTGAAKVSSQGEDTPTLLERSPTPVPPFFDCPTAAVAFGSRLRDSRTAGGGLLLHPDDAAGGGLAAGEEKFLRRP